MGIFNRNVHKHLTKKNIKTSKSAGGRTTRKGALLDTTNFKAANELISDGIDVPMQGQMVLRERGVALKAKAKVNFGKLIVPGLLKLEVGASISGTALGKRTILVMRGPEVVHGTKRQNEQPIIIGCLEGWRFVGGGNLEATVGVGGDFGGAAFSGKSGEGFGGETSRITDAPSGDPDPAVSATVAEAKAEFFAGLKAEIGGEYDYYLAHDHAPMFTRKDEKPEANVRPAVEEVLKAGTVKGALKVRACDFINRNPQVFGKKISYRKNIFNAHVSTTDIISRLDTGMVTLPRNSTAFSEAMDHLRQLRPWAGHVSEFNGMTYLRIKGPKVNGSAKIGASVEASATCPIFSVGAELHADAVNFSAAYRRVYLKLQIVCAGSSAHPIQLYWQDYTVKYTTYKLNLGEAGFDIKAGLLGREFSLNEAVSGAQSGGKKITSLDDGLMELSKWANFAKIDGTTASVYSVGSTTMSYMGAAVYWDKPTAESVFGNSPRHISHKNLKKVVQLDAQPGTGMVHGATYTAGVLSRSWAALMKLTRVMVNIKDLYEPGMLGEEHIKQKIRDLNEDAKIEKFLRGANVFKKEFIKYAAVISCHPKYFARFLLEGAGDMATMIGGELGEEQGVLVEAAFRVHREQRKKLLKVNCTLKEGGEPTFVLDSSNGNNIVKLVLQRSKLRPMVIRLRHRFCGSADSSISLPLGINIRGTVDVGLEIKNVWNMQVEGIAALNEYYFKARDRIKTTAEQRDFVPPPPLLFCV
jgi:hypothetical protein